MASSFEEWLHRWVRRPDKTLRQLACFCCGRDPARFSREIWEYAELYNRTLRTLHAAVHVGQIRVIPHEDLRYTAEFPAPARKVLWDFDPYADDEEQERERTERDQQRAAAIPEPLIRFDKELWDWCSWLFPDICPPFNPAYFSTNSSVQLAAAAGKTTDPMTSPANAVVEPNSKPTGNAEIPNLFKQGPDGLWEVVYDGNRRVGVKDVAGMTLIRTLLAAPSRAFPATDLLQRSASAQLGTRPERETGRRRQSAWANEPGLDTTERFRGDPALDSTARRQLKERLQDLHAARKEANKRGDEDEIKRIEIEYDAIEKQVRADVGLAGRPRHIGSDIERDRQTASHQFERARRLLGEALPDLGGHLKRCVQSGAKFVYQPDQPITWMT